MGSILMLCATSTLAAGVNLPAKRVILRSLKAGNSSLDAGRFRQMAGRAGRAGFDSKGECLVMARKVELETVRHLVFSDLSPLRSWLTGHQLARALLEVVALKLVGKVSEVMSLFHASTLRSKTEAAGTDGETLSEELESCLQILYTNGFIHALDPKAIGVKTPSATSATNTQRGTAVTQSQLGQQQPIVTSSADVVGDGPPRTPPRAMAIDDTLHSTPLGDALVFSSLDPVSGQEVFSDLKRGLCGLRLDTDLHLVFLVAPVHSGIDPDWNHFAKLHSTMDEVSRQVAHLVGVNEGFLFQASCKAPAMARGNPNEPMKVRMERDREILVHKRFWVALILTELLGEVPLAKVAAKYAVSRGQLQSLQTIAATFCGMVIQFCDRLKWWGLSAVLGSLQPRLSFGVAAELVPLVQLDSVHPAKARHLYDDGFTTLEALAASTERRIEESLLRLRALESYRPDAAATKQKNSVIRADARRILQEARAAWDQQVQAGFDQAATRAAMQAPAAVDSSDEEGSPGMP